MQEYIERNLAETVIKKLVESDCTPFDKQDALDNLCSIPLADVQEVKHGHWEFEYHEGFEDYELPEFYVYSIAKCSCCKEKWGQNINTTVASRTSNFYWDHDENIAIPEEEKQKIRDHVKILSLRKQMPHYCEYCGAKMDGE